MKKRMALLLVSALMLLMTACGESLQAPTEPTQTEPLWAMDPADRPSEVPTEPPVTEETTVPTEPPMEAPETTEAPTEPPVTEPEYPMEEKFSPAEGMVYAKKKVNIRSQANTQSYVVDKLPMGEGVERIGISEDGWTAVLYKDEVCYISSEYLLDAPPSEEEIKAQEDPNQISKVEMDDQVYTNHDVNMRETPEYDGAILFKVPAYTELHRSGYVTSGWYEVTYKDKLGYINEAYIEEKYPDKSGETEPEEEDVLETVFTTREVNLRKGPGTDKTIITRVPEGTQLVRTAITSNGWGKVKYGDHEGYISGDYLTTTAPGGGEEAGSETYAPESEG